MKNTIFGAITSVLFAFVFVVGFATPAHAQFADDFGGGWGDSCCGGSYSSGIDYSSNASYDYGQGSYSDGIDYSYSPSYDYGQGSYSDGIDYSSDATYGSTGYGSTGYSTGGYSTGGYSTGGYSTGGGYKVGGGYGYSTPIYTTPAVHTTPSNTTVTTTTNTDASVCSHSVNTCNHDDHSVVNIQNPAPVINNNNVIANYAPTAPVQQYCAQGYYGTYPNCYRPAPIAQPVVYSSQTPYISLSQTPYTGLELGFWGSIAYWGFMVAFALFAAYLIAIKRVQNNVANYFKSVLFGTDDEEVEAPASDETPEAPAYVAASKTQGDEIDSFIMSQINRARHA